MTNGTDMSFIETVQAKERAIRESVQAFTDKTQRMNRELLDQISDLSSWQNGKPNGPSSEPTSEPVTEVEVELDDHLRNVATSLRALGDNLAAVANQISAEKSKSSPEPG